jgi:hypothetical protein
MCTDSGVEFDSEMFIWVCSSARSVPPTGHSLGKVARAALANGIFQERRAICSPVPVLHGDSKKSLVTVVVGLFCQSCTRHETLNMETRFGSRVPEARHVRSVLEHS